MSNAPQPVRVTILPGQLKEREGSFKNDAGENIDYKTRNQPARLEVNGFAYPYDVRLDKDQPPYAAGEYVLDLGAMLEINKSKHGLAKFAVLVPVAAAK